MTKEELLKENGRLKTENENFEDSGKTIRKELSKILGFTYIKNGRYGGDDEEKITILSWMEISAEIGKLKQGQKQFQATEIENIYEDVGVLKMQIKNICKSIERLQTQNENK